MVILWGLCEELGFYVVVQVEVMLQFLFHVFSPFFFLVFSLVFVLISGTVESWKVQWFTSIL